MISALISRLIILAFGTLYPAYSSYKAVRTRNVKEYVKWMMYWIVFALFTFAETFTDVLMSFWFPFYYELKVLIVFWLLSPATKGSSFLYRNFVHPALQKRENEIDDYLSQAKEKGYTAVMSMGSRGVTYATNVIVQTALKGGGGIMEHLRKSYSLSDLSPREDRRKKQLDTTDIAEEIEPLAPVKHRRSTTVGSSNVDMYFAEVDINVRQCPPTKDLLNEIRSSEDISSGYSSTDQLYEGVMTRAASVSLTRGRGRSASRQTKKTPSTEALEEDAGVSEDVQTSIPKEIDLMPLEASERCINTENSVTECTTNVIDTTLKLKDSNEQLIFYESESNSQLTENVISEHLNVESKLKKDDIRDGSSSPSFSSCDDPASTLSASSEEGSSFRSLSSSTQSINTLNDPNRGGRYRKHKAPFPPVQKKLDENIDENEWFDTNEEKPFGCVLENGCSKEEVYGSGEELVSPLRGYKESNV